MMLKKMRAHARTTEKWPEGWEEWVSQIVMDHGWARIVHGDDNLGGHDWTNPSPSHKPVYNPGYGRNVGGEMFVQTVSELTRSQLNTLEQLHFSDHVQIVHDKIGGKHEVLFEARKRPSSVAVGVVGARSSAGYWLSPLGLFYDVDTPSYTTSIDGGYHGAWSREFMGIDPFELHQKGWLRVTIERNSSGGGSLYWVGYSANSKQMRAMKDVASFRKLEVIRDRQSMYAKPPASGIVPTTIVGAPTGAYGEHKKEHITAAAVYYSDTDTVYLGDNTEDAHLSAISNGVDDDEVFQAGFFTSKGRFVDQYEGNDIAQKAGQGQASRGAAIESFDLTEMTASDFNSLPEERPHGFWVKPDGSFVVVTKWGGHLVAAREAGALEDASEVDATYAAREKKWVDAVFSKNGQGNMALYCRGFRCAQTAAQKRTIKDLAAFYGADNDDWSESVTRQLKKVLKENTELGLGKFEDLPDSIPYGFVVYPDGSFDVAQWFCHREIVSKALIRNNGGFHARRCVTMRSIREHADDSKNFYWDMYIPCRSKPKVTAAQIKTVKDLAAWYQVGLNHEKGFAL
jgi:hypothetical protein